MNKENILWKRKFECLVARLDDIKIEVDRATFENAHCRVWEVMETIYVSFELDICDSEERAIEFFGEGNYDVYKLERKGNP